MKIFQFIKSFFKYNENKRIMCKAFVYSAKYRFCILFIPSYKNKQKWGAIGEESPQEDTELNYRYAARVSRCVNKICDRTPWESKCLVRALTTQKLLHNKKIATTLYLGCGKDGETLVAHAWLRCGKYFFMGGDGTGYAIVSKFRK